MVAEAKHVSIAELIEALTSWKSFTTAAGNAGGRNPGNSAGESVKQ